ncbi:MAG: hypothetical protein K6E79_02995 [Pseudobutyrivibrio sp.]|nr:hypothetical protein [Pseudobutyrivibrio sp.]
MSFIKKQSIGIWMEAATLLLGIISFIVYSVNIAGAGYFHGARVDMAVRCGVIGLILSAVSIVLAEIPLEGIASKLVIMLSDCVRIAVPALFIAATLYIVSARVEGFAFIYFSNEEVLQEVQTAANLSSAHGAIANIIILGATALIGIIGAFFTTKKKNVL